LLFHRNRITSFSSTIRSSLNSTSASNSWSIWSWDKFSSNWIFYQVLLSLSSSRKILESI
jgi:hypothetical protein